MTTDNCTRIATCFHCESPVYDCDLDTTAPHLCPICDKPYAPLTEQQFRDALDVILNEQIDASFAFANRDYHKANAKITERYRLVNELISNLRTKGISF